MSGWTRFASLACALCILVGRTAAAGEPSNVVVVVVAPAGDARLRSVVLEHLRSAGADAKIDGVVTVDPLVFLAPPRELSAALAHVWIDFTHPDRGVLLLLDRTLERGLLRYVSRAHGDEIAREEIGHILETAIDGLMAGDTIGVARAELVDRPPPQRTHAVPAPPPRAPWTARAAAFYGVDAFGAGSVEHGPGLTLDALRRVGHLRLGGRLSVQGRFPAFVDVAPFSLRIESWATRFCLLGIVPTGPLALEGSIGAGFDVVRVDPLAATAGALFGPPVTQVYPIVRLAVAVAWARPRVALGVTVDVDPSERYTFTRDGTDASLFSANLVRLGAMIEIGTP